MTQPQDQPAGTEVAPTRVGRLIGSEFWDSPIHRSGRGEATDAGSLGLPEVSPDVQVANRGQLAEAPVATGDWQGVAGVRPVVASGLGWPMDSALMMATATSVPSVDAGESSLGWPSTGTQDRSDPDSGRPKGSARPPESPRSSRPAETPCPPDTLAHVAPIEHGDPGGLSPEDEPVSRETLLAGPIARQVESHKDLDETNATMSFPNTAPTPPGGASGGASSSVADDGLPGTASADGVVGAQLPADPGARTTSPALQGDFDAGAITTHPVGVPAPEADRSTDLNAKVFGTAGAHDNVLRTELAASVPPADDDTPLARSLAVNAQRPISWQVGGFRNPFGLGS